MLLLQTLAEQEGTNAASDAATLTGVTAGSTIIVVGMFWRAAGQTQTIAVADDLNGAYIRDFIHTVQTGTPVQAVGFFRLPNASAGDHVITVTPTGSASYFTWVAFEIDVDLALATKIAATGSSTTPGSGTTPSTTLVDEAFVVGAFHVVANQASITVEVTSPTWTVASEQLNFSAQNAGEIVQKITAAEATVAANWTNASSSDWVAGICAYVEAGGGGGGQHASVSIG